MNFFPSISFPTPFGPSTRAVVTLASAAIVVFYTFAVGQRAIHTLELQQEAATLERQRTALELRGLELGAERQRLLDGTDVETIARRELNYIKQGETAVVVLPSAAAIERARLAAEAPQRPAERSLWESVWKVLTGG